MSQTHHKTRFISKADAAVKRAYTVSMVADMWSVSEGMIYKLINSGELGCIRFGRCVRVRPEHIEAYENAGCQQSALNAPQSTASLQASGTSSGVRTVAPSAIRQARRRG